MPYAEIGLAILANIGGLEKIFSGTFRISTSRKIAIADEITGEVRSGLNSFPASARKKLQIEIQKSIDSYIINSTSSRKNRINEWWEKKKNEFNWNPNEDVNNFFQYVKWALLSYSAGIRTESTNFAVMRRLVETAIIPVINNYEAKIKEETAQPKTESGTGFGIGLPIIAVAAISLLTKS